MLQKIMSINFRNKDFYGRIKLRDTSLETKRVEDKPNCYKQVIILSILRSSQRRIILTKMRS